MWVGVVVFEIGIGEFHSLDLLVKLGNSEWSIGRSWRHLHNIQHFKRSHALAVGRKFVNCPATVSCRDGLDPLRLEVGKIFGGHGSTERLRGAENRLCDFTFVVDIGPVIGDCAQGLPEIRIAEELANFRHFAFGQIHPLTFGIVRESLRSVTPKAVNQFRNRIAVIGIKDRWTEQVFPCQFAEAIVQGVPSSHRSGNSNRVDAPKWHLRRALGFHVLESETLRRPAA